jgi:hypothetical protein
MGFHNFKFKTWLKLTLSFFLPLAIIIEIVVPNQDLSERLIKFPFLIVLLILGFLAFEIFYVFFSSWIYDVVDWALKNEDDNDENMKDGKTGDKTFLTTCFVTYTILIIAILFCFSKTSH